MNWNIKYLEFRFEDIQNPLETATNFKDGTLFLESMIVSRFKLPQDLPAIQSILTSQSGSLESLDLSRFESTIPNVFPVSRTVEIKNLRTLYISMYSFDSFNILLNFPNLEIFVCSGYSDNKVEQSEFPTGFTLQECK